MRGTGHAYFSDLIHFYRAFADWAWLERHRYELDPDRVIRIAGDYIAAFLDWRMRGASSHTLLLRPTYAERVEGPLQITQERVENVVHSAVWRLLEVALEKATMPMPSAGIIPTWVRV